MILESESESDGFWNFLNPLAWAAKTADNAVQDTITGFFLSIFDAGLWVLTWALRLMDKYLTPKIGASGPLADIYGVALWGAGVLVTMLFIFNIGIAVWRRDGKTLGQTVAGAAQFLVVTGGWFAYAVAVLHACNEVSLMLMDTLLDIDAWAGWKPIDTSSMLEQRLETSTAAILALLGLFLWLAGIGHFMVMLGRAAALAILAATTPIAAAGLVGESTRTWFWRSVRWFHAAALTPVLTVLVIGIGVKLGEGTANGAAGSTEHVIGSAMTSVVLILVSVASPLALFRLLAFVDPGTSSGAAMRQGAAAMGGMQGILSGGSGGGSSAASQSSADGSAGEAQRNSAVAGQAGGMAAALGPVGAGFAAGIGIVMGAGTKLAGSTTDTLNQSGVGSGGYFPDSDYNRGPQRFNPDARDPQDSGGNDIDSGSMAPPTPGGASQPSTSGAGGGGISGGAAPSGGAAGGAGAGGAAAVPPVV